MKYRRKARELALQVLYSIQKNERVPEHVLEEPFFEKAPKPSWEHARYLIDGCLNNKSEFEEIISSISENWDINRMPDIDRIILKMALFEMKNLEDIPLVVSINEAINLAKKFSTEESGRFINGILDQYHKTVLLGKDGKGK